jgi:predicted nucleic acid-binding protein
LTLVDTSVWIDHLRRTDPDLQALLHDGLVVWHPFVTGELALAHLRNRDEILDLLQALPSIDVAAHAAVLSFIADHQLAGTGIGWVDAHLLTAAAAARASLLTHDRTLAAQARRIGLADSKR